jgi:methionine-rich copper-binding protein CopC
LREGILIKKNMLLILIFTITVLIFINGASASANLTNNQKEKILKVQMPFIKNQGQINDSNIKYYTETFAGRVYVTNNGLKYYLKGTKTSYNVEETYVNSNTVNVKGTDKSITKVNYFKRNNSQTKIATYNQVKYSNLYDNIDLNLKAYGNNIEKIFTIHPNGNSKDIWIRLNGNYKLKVNNQGQLEILTTQSILKLSTPFAYQEINGKRVNITVSYFIKGNKYTFSLGHYNKSYDLIIDPLLASTYLGGTQTDYGYCIDLDQDNNVFIGGHTGSNDFPVTNPSVNSYSGSGDIFISKFDSNLTTLLASTYIGGTNYDTILDMALDKTGNIYFTGITSSSDFPTTSGAYNTSYHKNDQGSFLFYDAFVSKINNNLDTILASTYIGGKYDDVGRAIAIDKHNDVYITGNTYSKEFPSTIGSYDNTYNGNESIFISKLNSNLTTLYASTFIGSGSVSNIAIDSSQNIFIAGGADATFPTTSGSYDETFNGGSSDAFIAKFDNNLATLLASTFLGGGLGDGVSKIVLDSSDNIYIGGSTANSTFLFPTTVNAYNRAIGNGGEDIFLSKLDNNLTTLFASTFLGGNNFNELMDMVLDQYQNVYIFVFTGSTDLPAFYGVYDTYNINGSVYIAKFEKNLSNLVASSYFPANIPRGIAVDPSGNVYITGETYGSIPTTTGAYDKLFNGGYEDSYVSKLDSNLLGPPRVILTGPENNASNVDANKVINITFNLPIKAGSAYEGITLKDQNNVEIPITKLIDGVNLIINHPNLSKNTKYTLSLPADSIATLTGCQLTDSYNFKFTVDNILPSVISVDPANNTMTKTLNKTIKITFSEPIQKGSSYDSISITGPSGVIPITKNIEGNSLVLIPTSNYVNGNYTINIPVNAVLDLAGNSLTPSTSRFTVDTVSPTVNASSKGGLFNTSRSVILTVKDNQDPNSKIYYTTNGTNWNQFTGSGTVLINKEGITNLEFYAVDAAGNPSIHTKYSYTIDKKIPTASANLKNGSYNTSKTVTLSISESGTIYYTKNGITPTKASTKYTGPISITSTTTLKFIAVDKAGNKSPVYTQKYIIDKTAPKVSSTNPKNGATGFSRTATISIKFQENINSSVNWSKIYVKNLKNGKLVSISKSISKNGLYIKMGSTRYAYTWYQVYIPKAAIKDDAGNKLTAGYTFKFETGPSSVTLE